MRKKLHMRGRLAAAMGTEALSPNAAKMTAAEMRNTFQESMFAGKVVNFTFKIPKGV